MKNTVDPSLKSVSGIYKRNLAIVCPIKQSRGGCFMGCKEKGLANSVHPPATLCELEFFRHHC